MFHSNPHLLTLVAEIMGEAPKLAQHLSHKPSVLDSVLDPKFFDAPPSPDELHRDLEAILQQTEYVEEMLDATRRWANDRWFQIGVQSLRGHQQPKTTAIALSYIAECSVVLLNSAMAKEFELRHGVVPGSEMVVLALGKLGGREMTSTSDLDMIFVYKAPAEAKNSNGPKPLALTQYFARLSQRVINSITAQTSEGRLFEVDMRLRPSGNAGPIASSLQAFVQYHDELSWTWEHMAMTRARVVAGPPNLRQEVEGVITEVLTQPRDSSKLLTDVAEMRSRIDNEHHTENPLAVKHLRGGLVDIEFISQYLQLKHAHEHQEILSPNTHKAIGNLMEYGFLNNKNGETLISALELWQGIQGLFRLTMEEHIPKDLDHEIPKGLQEGLATLGQVDNFKSLLEKISITAGAVQRIFKALIETPAGQIKAK
jgi:glutamate-ammonia-ligase adenylyltransferase